MDSEEEGPNDEEGEEDDGNQFLVGFMFGNVGTDMRLEEDYLDEASPSVHLCSQSASVVPTAKPYFILDQWFLLLPTRSTGCP